MKNFNRISIIVLHVIASFFAGLNYAIAADSDEEKVNIISTSTIYTYNGDSKKKEVSDAQAACEMVIKDECSINDCSDRNWKVDGEPEIKGTYVNCKYTGDNGLVWGSSPAVVEVICPENAESSWDGEASYCKCLSNFVAVADKCVEAPAAQPSPVPLLETAEQPLLGPGQEIAKYVNGADGLLASLDKEGMLDLYIKAGPNTPRGGQMFDEALSAYGTNVKGIRGTWLGGGELASNFDSFKAGLKAGLTPQDAALGTFTGKMAARSGFTKVSVITNQANKVVVEFKR